MLLLIFIPRKNLTFQCFSPCAHAISWQCYQEFVGEAKVSSCNHYPHLVISLAHFSLSPTLYLLSFIFPFYFPFSVTWFIYFSSFLHFLTFCSPIFHLILISSDPPCLLHIPCLPSTIPPPLQHLWLPISPSSLSKSPSYRHLLYQNPKCAHITLGDVKYQWDISQHLVSGYN